MSNMSNKRPRLAVRFVLANNLPTSIMRITADTATMFARLGVRTTVLFPVVDWWDFKMFEISRLNFNYKLRWVFWLALEALWNTLIRRHWCGFKYYNVDPSVREVRYFVTPSLADGREDEITVVHHPYVIPHLLGSPMDHRMKIVGVVHNNYELEMQSPWPEHAAWKRHCVVLEQRLLSIPRFATSEEAKRAAERLGIPIQRVINGGIDLNLFHPARSRPNSGCLTVSLYCVAHVQKGQWFGIEAVKTLKSIDSSIRLCSVGEVIPGHATIFDHNYGYLHGEEYVKAIQESDIFIYPSLYDGFPAPPLQAMACGSALVTTSVEGVIEYAVNEENCLLCEPGNVEMMRGQIIQLIRDKELRERLRSNGPKTAETYSVECSVRQLLEFLIEIYGDANTSAQ